MNFRIKKEIVKVFGVLFFLGTTFFLGNLLQKQGGAWLAPTQDPPQGNISLQQTRSWLCWDQDILPPQTVTTTPLSLTSMRLQWSATPGMHSYRVSMSLLEEGPFTEVDILEHPTGHLDLTGLLSDSDYYFVVQASTNGTNWSDTSAIVHIKMPIIPGAPTGLTVSIYSETALDLSWTAPSNNGGASITGYKIERQTSGGSWSTIVANTGNANTTYRNTGLTTNTPYGYRVSAITVTESAPSTLSTKYSGHCYTTTGDCDSGYTSILGGSQSGCATVGPVTSPYPGSANDRYRVFSNDQTLTTTCSSVGTQQRTRQAQLSTNSGTSYAFAGSAVNCRNCVSSSTCTWTPIWYNDAWKCWTNSNCTTVVTVGSGCTCSQPCFGGHDPCAWNRTCVDQSATIRWCCRN